MRLLKLSLLLNVVFCGFACEKNVQEVRRPGEPDIVAPGGSAQASGSGSPSTPHGAPKSIAGKPRTP